MGSGFRFMIMPAVTVLALVMLITPGCDDSGPVSSNPNQPFIPADPVPSNGSSTESLLMTLEWRGGDPDGDSVVYDVYLGTTRLPELVAEAITDTIFIPDILEINAKYFWRVVARDPDGNSISSPLWTFQTTVEHGNFIFPSSVGNSWTYRGGYYYCNPTIDIVPEGLSLDTFAIQQFSEIVSLDILSDGSEAYRITSTFNRWGQFRDHYSYQESSWYRDEADGQYLVASGPFGYGQQPHRPETVWPIMAPGKESLQLTSFDPIDSYHLLDPPLREIAYPLETGKTWLWMNYPYSTIKKTVIGRQTIEVPAGVFECWEIRWLFQAGDVYEPRQLEMVDYVADIGVVARYMRVNGLYWGGGPQVGWQPEGSSGFVDFVEYYELEEYYVK